jgi:hypothetical protein
MQALLIAGSLQELELQKKIKIIKRKGIVSLV